MPESRIKYSIIIPVYNAEKSISRVLEALLKQNGIRDAEIIAVDDGSSDNSPVIIEKYPVRYIRKNNSGPAAARNLGVNNSGGEIILFIDSDCIPQPGWLKAMTAPFENPEINGVKGRYITRQNSLTARFVQLEFEERYRMLEKQQYIDFVDSYSAAFRKEAFLNAGGFDESFPKADNEDVDLSYKLAAAGCKMVYRPEAVVEHTHPANLKKYLKVKFSRGFWRMAVYKAHPGKAVKDSYTPQTLKLQILTAGLFWLALLLSVSTLKFIFVALVTFIFLLLTVPFISRTFQYDRKAAVIAPVMLFFRSCCFLTGVLYGLIHHSVMKKQKY